MDYLTTSCSIAIGLVFCAAAVSKVRNRTSFDAFVLSMSRHSLVSSSRSRALAVMVVGAEFGIALILLPVLLEAASFALPFGRVAEMMLLGGAAVLVSVFVVVTLATIRSGTAAPCNCFGASTTTVGPRHLIRDAILLAVAIAGLAGRAFVPVPAPDAVGTAVALGAGCAAALLIIGFVELTGLFAPARPPAGAAGHRR